VTDTRRSFYLASRQDDFAETPIDESWLDTSSIPYVMPANDNVQANEGLSALWGNALRRLIALHRLRWRDCLDMIGPTL
jgi:hypothetical protein